MAFYRPGIGISTRASATPRGIPTNTGTWFVAGAAQKGSTTVPQFIRSFGDFTTYFGGRSVGSTVFTMYDAVETFFREGGSQAYVIRFEGPSAVAATRTLLDGSAGNSLKVSANSVGTWGNSLTVQVVAGVTGGTFILVIANSGVEVERSPELTDTVAAMAWQSKWVAVTAPTSPSGLDPAVIGASALSTGADDNAGITDPIRVTSLTYFTADLGAGQISIPGNLTGGNRTALIAHATLNNRQALLDPTNTGTKATLITEAQGLQAVGNEYAALVGPWVYIPGIDAGTVRTVPPSALVAGLIARNDAANNTAVPAAGVNGKAQYVLGVTQPPFSDADRQDLNDAGYNLIRSHNDSLGLYGYRTSGIKTGPWAYLSIQRTRMALVAEYSLVADNYVFAILDGKKHTISQFGGEIKAVNEKYRNLGALYGDTPEEAYFVDVSESVNTPDTIANGELRALSEVKIAGFAEAVLIDFVKIALNQSL